MSTYTPATDMASKRLLKDCTINARVTKTHITRRDIRLRREPHPAARTLNKSEKPTRRLDTNPLPLYPLHARFTRYKSTWRSLALGFAEQEAEDKRFLETQIRFYMRDSQMGNVPIELPLAPYEEEMECEYDTMGSRAAFEMSGGVFGSPLASPKTSLSSSSNANAFGNSAGSGGTASTFGVSTLASSMGSQPSVAAFGGFASSMHVGNTTSSSSNVNMTNAPNVSTVHVAAAPTLPTAPVPAPPSLQPPQPVTAAPITPVQFAGLGFLPSKPLQSEKAAAPQSAPSASVQFAGLGFLPSKPLPTEKVPTPQPAPTSQHKDVVVPPSEAPKAKPAESSKPSPSEKAQSPQPTPPSQRKAATMAAFEPPKTKPAESTKPLTPPSPKSDDNAGPGPPRAKLTAKARSTATQLPPKDAPKSDVEINMGAFSEAKISTSAALVSAFCNPHFKQFFADEMKSLKKCLKAKKEIRGSHLVYLNRSLKWVIDGDEAGWFNPDIDLESDDVGDWRGKLNIFMKVLEEVVGDGTAGVAADTRVKIEKVFKLFAAEEELNEEFGREGFP